MQRALLIALGCSLVVAGSLGARTVVVAVGIDHYGVQAWGTLPSCVNDAVGFLTHLRDYDGTKWPERYIAVDGDATKANIRLNIQHFAGQLVDGDVFVYFQSSHGGQAGGTNTFLCCYDAAYTDDELAADLVSFAAGVTVIVIVDACNSGGLIIDEFSSALTVSSSALAAPSPWTFGADVLANIADLRQASGAILKTTGGASVAFMTACAYDQWCFAGNPYSLFTKYLLEAFLEGDADSNTSLSFYELYAYAAPRAKADAVLAGYETGYQDAQSYNDTLLQGTAVVEVVPLVPPPGGNTGVGGALPLVADEPDVAPAAGGGGGCAVDAASRVNPLVLVPWLFVLAVAAGRRAHRRRMPGLVSSSRA